MRAFIESIVKTAATELGIMHVAEKTSTPSNLTMPKPRIDIEFMPDTYILTGKKLSMRREGNKQVIVHEKYQIDSPVMLYITDNDDLRLSRLADELLLKLPKGAADRNNNWVSIRASSAEWSKSGATTVGAKQIKVMHERTRTIRVGFTWRLTYEQAALYITDIKIIPIIGD